MLTSKRIGETVTPTTFFMSLNKTISLDIAIVSYNAEKFIQQALDSILMQILPDNINVRLLIADDCSTDETLNIIKRNEICISETGCSLSGMPVILRPLFSVISEESRNMGITENYRRMFTSCSADYVAVLEGDDYWCNPYRLWHHIDFLEQHKECVMSVNPYVVCNNNTFESIGTTFFVDNEYKLITFKDLLSYNHVANFSSCVYRGSAINNINPEMYNVNVSNIDDWLVALEITQYGICAKLHEYSTIYRIHSSNYYGTRNQYSVLVDINNRIDAYDIYFGKKFHDVFMLHKEENINVLHLYRDVELQSRLPKIICAVIFGCRKILYYVCHVPFWLVPPKIKNKLKNKLKK